MPSEGATPHPSQRIAELGAAQHGVVGRDQLRALGVPESAIQSAVRLGRLHRVHRGVYAVGHTALVMRGRWVAAVLACGDGAVLSHGAAGALWRLRARVRVGGGGGGAIDVTVPTLAGRRSRPGIALHHSRALPAEEVTDRGGIPVTTPARTVMDLAAVLPRRALERAIDEGARLRLLREADLDAVIAAHAGHCGAARVGSLLKEHRIGSTFTRSQLEERFLALCRSNSLPQPLTSQRVDRYEVDFLWTEGRVIVETDGFASHRTLQAFEHDHERDARLDLLGYLVRRFTYRQVVRQPAVVVSRTRSALRERGVIG